MFGLSFLNAGILIASLATIIPLLIHLFVKNKPQKVFFSSLKFLREILEERRRKMTINQLILLILRMLIILFTVFALAKPVVKLPFISKGNYHPPTAVAFILDTSPSMDYVIDQKTQIQRGLDIIKNIQAEMNNKDISLFLTSDHLHNSLKSRLIYGLIPERDLNEISFTWTPEPISRLLIQAQEELEKSRFLHKEIYVISDLQDTDLPTDMQIPVSFISTFNDSIRVNLSVEKISVKKEPVAGTVQRIAEFEIVNYSPLNQRDQIIRLSLNGTTIAEKMINLAPFERKMDYFVIDHENLEWNYGWVEVRNERFIPDNRYYFSFYSDPNPKIGIVSNLGNIPRPIEVLADIFIGENGQLEYLSEDNFQLSDRDKYHFLIFYLNHFSSRTQAMIQELNKNDYKCLFILSNNMSNDAKNFLANNYNLTINSGAVTELSPVSAFHQWHRIIGDFDFKTNLNLRAKPALEIAYSNKNTPLITTDKTPLIIENNDIFINIDFSARAQNFLSYPAFPVIVYRSFSWISKYDGVLNNYSIGESFNYRQGLLKSPSGNDYQIENTSFKFTEPGVWTYIDNAGKNSFLAVNMTDFENQSKHKPMSDSKIDNINIIGTDYKNRVLQQDKGNEIWKILLWGALLFLITEMLLVLFLQKKAK